MCLLSVYSTRTCSSCVAPPLSPYAFSAISAAFLLVQRTPLSAFPHGAACLPPWWSLPGPVCAKV